MICGFCAAVVPAETAVADEPQGLLVDDFSGLNPYTKQQISNPYWNHPEVRDPWWCDPYPDACPWVQNLGDLAFHTNHLGYFTDAVSTEAWRTSLGALELAWQDDAGAYWYSAFQTGAGQSIDVSSYTRLQFRVKGDAAGNEDWHLRINDTDVEVEASVQLSTWCVIPPASGSHEDWQTCQIPLSEFVGGGLDATQATSVVFEFDIPGQGPPGTTYTIFIDDLMFDIDQAVPDPPAPKPPSTGPVQIVDGQLLLDGQPYLIRGVGYTPTPIGQTPDVGVVQGVYNPYTTTIITRDAPLLSGAGMNTVRTVGRFDLIRNEYIDENGLYVVERTYGNRAILDLDASGIKVIAGFWVPYEIGLANDWAKARLTEEFQDYVSQYAAEPGLLFWVIGNENNLVNGYDWRWYHFANVLAQAAYTVEGTTYHPVAIVEADLETLGDPGLGSDDTHLSHIDIIGINAYRGKQWDSFFSFYEGATAKPLWISEYGIDAWHTNDPSNPVDGVLDEAAQADWDVKIWLELFRHQARVIGATAMEYVDEWWKDRDAAQLSGHDYGGFDFSDNPGSLPDDFMNEEWWGVVRYDDTQPDLVIPRPALDRLYSPTIGGRVLDEQGNVVPDARVVLRAQTGGRKQLVTDEQGLYAYPQLPLGSYAVMAFQPPNLRSQRVIVTVTETDPTRVVDLVLVPVP